MDGMFGTGIAGRKGNCFHTNKTGCDNNVTFVLLHEILQCDARQGQDTKHIEVKHLLINSQVNVFPICSLGPASIVHQNIKLQHKTSLCTCHNIKQLYRYKNKILYCVSISDLVEMLVDFAAVRLYYLTKMINDLLKITSVLLHRHYIHWQHQDIFLCKILSNV